MSGIFPYQVLSLCSVVLNVVLIISNKKFKPLAVFFIFSFTYIYVSIPYFFQGVPLGGGYSDFIDEAYYQKVLVIHSLMISVIALVLPKFDKSFLLRDLLPKRESNLTFYVLIVLMLYMALFSKTGTNILESGGYASDDFKTERVGGLSIFGYFLIILPVGYIYSNGERFKKLLLIICTIIYCIKGVLFGGRIEILQASLLIFILFIDNKKISLGKIILYSTVPAYVLAIFGAIRSNPLIILEGMDEILMRPFNDYLSVFGNQMNVYYSSNRLVGMVDTEVISYWQRIETFAYNLIAPVVPYGRLPDIANLAGYKKDEFAAGGGALISVYFWVFLSYPGVVMIGTYFGWIMRKIKRSSSTYFGLYLIMVLSTYPTWLGYNPISMFKLSFYVIPFYFLIRHVFERFTHKDFYTSISPGDKPKTHKEGLG